MPLYTMDGQLLSQSPFDDEFRRVSAFLSKEQLRAIRQSLHQGAGIGEIRVTMFDTEIGRTTSPLRELVGACSENRWLFRRILALLVKDVVMEKVEAWCLVDDQEGVYVRTPRFDKACCG